MKKIKKFWESLFKRPRYIKVEPQDKGSLIVIEIERETGSLTESLAISPERAEHLHKLTHEVFHKSENIVEVLAIVSKECVHANELFYVSHITANLQRDHQPPRFIQAILGGRKG
jgi:hypothetical protein